MLIIQNGILVEPDGTRPGDVALEDGVIVEVGDSIESIPKGKNGACETLDAAGCFVFPGFIDAHTHLDMDNGVTVTADDFNTGSAAAVVGGTTMLVD
ncbi:MAG: amidohydrolase family protein, partial [Clostridia bacterium]|nr:amidohydrolase family protein [Clostridia bacterium]